MSKKLKSAILAEKVSVRNKITGEVNVWFRGRDLQRHTLILRTFAEEELAPKHTEAVLLQFSNLEDLVKQGLIEIL